MTIPNTTRRNFLKLAATAGGGLLIGFHWADAQASTSSAVAVIGEDALAAGSIEFNSYLSIGTDDIITIMSPNPELGQNIKTSFPMIVAEELDADWQKVKVVQAPLDSKRFERQVTGGSGAVPHSWERLRKAGATARTLLVEAASKRWNVPVASLTTDKSMVMQNPGRRSVTVNWLLRHRVRPFLPISNLRTRRILS